MVKKAKTTITSFKYIKMRILIKQFIVAIILTLNQVSFAQTKENNQLNSMNQMNDVVVKNVSVITMKTDEVLKNQDVIIKNGKIISISETKNSNHKNMSVINATGKYMVPTLADAHVHFPENEAEMDRLMQLNLINGVTKLRSMRGDWKHLEWRKKYNTVTSIYPKLYLSAPAISSKFSFTDEQLIDYINKSKDFDFVKILSIKDEALFAKFDSLCKLNNIKIAGHFPSNISDNLIFNSNYSSFEHLGGLTTDEKVLENRLSLIREKRITVCPTLSWYSIGSGRYTYDQLKNLPGMEFVSKTIVDDWIEKTKQYRKKMGNEAYTQEVIAELEKLDHKYEIIKRLNESGVKMLLSPDSSSKYMVSGFGMVGEMELLKNAELSNYEILKMATINFSEFFNEDYGTIEIGKEADFILLNNNPLEDLNTLKKIEGLYFNNQFLDYKKLETIGKYLLETSQN